MPLGADPLYLVGRRRRIPARAGPVGVEVFAARLVDTFVGVRPEIVALRLDQTGPKPAGAVGIEIGEGGGEARYRQAVMRGVGNRALLQKDSISR